VENKLQIENEIKKHPLLKTLRRTITINNQNYTELLHINTSFEEIDNMIQGIITKIEFTPENYIKIMEENAKLKTENKTIKELLKRSHIKLPYEFKNNNETIVLSDKDFNYEKNKWRRKTKAKDGFFHLDGKQYTLLIGTREEVWNDVAYHTSGGLTKTDLMIGADGKIVSKIKCISSKLDNHLKDYAKPSNNTLL
jgi:regulator of replication initiation timing